MRPDVSVWYSTRDGSALARSDYLGEQRDGDLCRRDNGRDGQDLNVSGDRTVEPDETFFLDLANATNATLARTQRRRHRS